MSKVLDAKGYFGLMPIIENLTSELAVNIYDTSITHYRLLVNDVPLIEDYTAINEKFITAPYIFDNTVSLKIETGIESKGSIKSQEKLKMVIKSDSPYLKSGIIINQGASDDKYITTSYGITEYPNTFQRQADFPLDRSSLFENLAQAVSYAAMSPIAYEGQIISIKTKDSVDMGILKTSDIPGIKFIILKLSDYINTFESEIARLENIVNTNADNFKDELKITNHKIGTWSTTEVIKDMTAELNWEINMPIEADYYEVYFNNELVSDTKMPLSKLFISAPLIFEADDAIMELVFYKDIKNASNVVETQQLFKVRADTLFRSENIILGVLNLVED